jgi:DnaJ-class molecular chaperone
MPQHLPASRICRDCDGFATATITTGIRRPDGTRATLPVACRTCKGTGRTDLAGAFATARR